MSLMTGAPRVTPLTATGETRGAEVSEAVFRRMLEARPDLGDDLSKALHIRMPKRAQAVAGVAPVAPETQNHFRTIGKFVSR